jgi:lipid-binding SYLF domain-containing protein
MTSKHVYSVTLLAAIAAIVAGCSTAPTDSGSREELRQDVSDTMQRLNYEDPGLPQFLHDADAYVVFPTVGKGAAVVGGAYGHGAVYERGRFIGYADISQATIGAQLGGQSFTEVIAFESPASVQKFEAGQLTFDANASAVALKSGAAASAKYENGIAVFVEPVAGLMVEAAIGGQTFTFQPREGYQDNYSNNDNNNPGNSAQNASSN